MMASFPTFSVFADALMAGLASRSHDWLYWEISESIEFLLSTPNTRESLLSGPRPKGIVQCTLQKSDQTWVMMECELSQSPSPSMTLENLIASKGIVSTTFEMKYLNDCIQHKQPLFDSNENSELSEFWQSLVPKQPARAYQFLHVKNSKGQYRQTLCPIF